MKNNNTAIFENSSRRTLHFAVTSRWPDTSDSRAHEFMTPSWSRSTSNFYVLIGQNLTCEKFMQRLESCLLIGM